MIVIRNITLALVLLAWAAPSTLAQDRTGPRPAAPPSTVTISTVAGGVRVAALGNVRQIRLEVFGEGGDSLYNSGFKAGNVFDWRLEGAQGLPLPDGTYLCVVTFTDVSGAVWTKQGGFVLQAGRASLRLGEGQHPDADGNDKARGVAAREEAGALTLAAHDGQDGQLVSTRGGLSFRAGDFFAGKDKELLRLTPEGDLGVGVSAPKAKLDVAGTIRARGGIQFDDGTVLTSAKQAQRLGAAAFGGTAAADPMGTAAVAGTGTANKLPKWTDGAGTLADSSLFEDAAGNIGVGTSVPGGVLDLQRSSSADLLQRFWNTGTGGAKLRYVAATGATSQLQITDNTEWLAAIAGNNQTGLQFRVRPTGATNTEDVLNQSAVLTLARSGNVGVGITNPNVNFKLDVAGNLHVSGSAVVDGNIAAKYQDVAEWVPAREPLAAGTVVALDPSRSNTVRASARPYDTHVAGIVSAQPGVILGEGGAGKVMVATTGRVKVKVDASRRPIRVGDLLVTSPRAGVAMRSLPVRAGRARIHRPGTIIGKALEPLAKGRGEILVLLSLQ